MKLINLVDIKLNRLTVKSRGPNDKQGKPQWWCLCTCGIGVLVSGKHLRKGRSKSCGCLNRERASERMSKLNYTRTGVKNPNWKGTSTENHLIRTSKNYHDWRDQVFDRDNYTCQKCGDNSGGNLNAHHIESFNNTPELRTEISNGVTLCKVCHTDFHHQQGYGDNTKYQFFKWLRIS